MDNNAFIHSVLFFISITKAVGFRQPLFYGCVWCNFDQGETRSAINTPTLPSKNVLMELWHVLSGLDGLISYIHMGKVYYYIHSYQISIKQLCSLLFWSNYEIWQNYQTISINSSFPPCSRFWLQKSILKTN